MTLAAIMLIAAAAMAVLLALAELLAHAAHARFLASVILGEDGRTSTSKTFIFLWTLLIGWALIALVVGGQLVGQHACVHLPNPVTACGHDQLGRFQAGWHHFVRAGLSGDYLVLLGIPAAAGVAAKGVTQSQVAGAGFKKPRAPGSGGVLARLAEIFSADDGTTDIGDFQYLIFNVVTGVYFVARFLSPDGTGLPTIPATLLGLTSVSAGLYVGKKAVSNSQPTVSGVFPLPLHDGQPFTVIGTGLVPDAGSPTSVTPQITIDGVPATAVAAAGDHLIAKAPHNLGPGGIPMIRQLRVLNPYGGITADFPVQCL